MRVKVIFVLVIFVIKDSYSHSLPSLKNDTQNGSASINYNSFHTNHQPIKSKTDLSSQQTENVRQIIAAEQKNQAQRMKELSGIVNHGRKLDTSYGETEEDRFPTLEELRAKCQHFSRLFGLSQTGSPSVERLSNSDITERHAGTAASSKTEYYNRPVEITRRPVYIRNRPTFIEKNNNGFYLTAAPTTENDVTTTKRPYWLSSTSFPSSTHSSQSYNTGYTNTTTSSTSTSTSSTSTTESSNLETNNSDNNNVSTTERPKIKIRYTKFEPVILQKTILTDGRILYHWHKSIPTSALELPAPIPPIAAPIIPSYEFPPDMPVPLATRNFPPIEPITEPTTTTTTTERSSWLFVPFSGLFGGSNEEEQEETTTVKPSTTTLTTTTVISVSQNSSTFSKLSNLDITTEGSKLQQQLKLVVPVNYDDIDASLNSQNKPWDYNRYGYFSKGVRASNPTFSQPPYHVIRNIEIPQSVPRYSLGYTGSGYGMTFNNGLPYSTYGAGYGTYQRSTGLEKDNRRLDDVSV